MPQAPEFLRKLWGGVQGIGDDKAEKHLKDKGFRLLKNWCWVPPSKEYEMTEDDWNAIDFLQLEWDYGSLIELHKFDAVSKLPDVYYYF